MGIFGGGLFDFNRDGRTDLDEEWLGLMIARESMKQKDSPPPDSSIDILDIVFWIIAALVVMKAIVAIAGLFGG